MVVQNVVKGLWHYVLLCVWVLDHEQEAEVICLLVKVIVGFRYNAHYLAHALDLFDQCYF